ncbi:DUF4232 domain-containing protein [Oerskovia jenensis]|uniref:hypothetical protein n=1 Tax=Oerskovia jenensis TaxID=162169 RepID=UPI0036DCC519
MNDKHLPPTPLHLDTAFSDIAASAGAAATDGTTGTLEVRRLVKRSRRQRATALGASGFVVLGLAGVGLSGLLTPAPVEILPAPPITPSPTASVEPLPGTFAPTCGDDLSDLQATTLPLALTHNGAEYRPLDLTNTSDSPVTVGSFGHVAVYLLDAEGKVISVPTADEPPTDEATDRVDLGPGDSASLWPSDVAACGTALPPAGTYPALGLATAEITRQGQETATSTVVGGRWTVTIDDTGRLTSIAGVRVDDEPTETAAPPPEAPAAPVDPIVVRDVLEGDSSAVFEALREAATTGAPASVDLFYTARAEWNLVRVVERAGAREMTVVDLSETPGRPRTTSDGGWTMSVHGGAFFDDTLPQVGMNGSLEFERLLGTFDVTLDESGAVPAFVLQVVDGGAPDTAPPTKDREVCRAFDEYGRSSEGLYPPMAADLAILSDVSLPAAESARYAEIRDRWVESPRVWWSMVGYYQALRAGYPTGDGIVGACIGHWDVVE